MRSRIGRCPSACLRSRTTRARRMLGRPSKRRDPQPVPPRSRTPSGRMRHVVVHQMAQDRRAGRGGTFARQRVDVRREALQDPRGRRCRQRQEPVLGLHQALTQRHRPAGPGPRPAALDQARRCHDVRDRVPVGDLVEMDIVARDTVHRGLGVGQDVEDRDAPCRAPRLRARSPAGRRGSLGNVAWGADVSRRCSTANARATMPFAVSGRWEIPTCSRIPAADRSACSGRVQVGKGVEHRRGEHVARDPADRVEVDVQRHARPFGERGTALGARRTARRTGLPESPRFPDRRAPRCCCAIASSTLCVRATPVSA